MEQKQIESPAQIEALTEEQLKQVSGAMFVLTLCGDTPCIGSFRSGGGGDFSGGHGASGSW